MRGLRNISALLLVLVFMVPATGFYFTRHTCLQTGEVNLVLDNSYACCEKHGRSATERNTTTEPPFSCCRDAAPDMNATPEQNAAPDRNGSDGVSCLEGGPASPCCINDGNYIKSDEEYTSPQKFEIPPLELLPAVSLYTRDLFQDLQSAADETANSPPYTLSSTDILHRHAVLIL